MLEIVARGAMGCVIGQAIPKACYSRACILSWPLTSSSTVAKPANLVNCANLCLLDSTRWLAAMALFYV